MALPSSTQVQVYHRLVQNNDIITIQYATVETYTFNMSSPVVPLPIARQLGGPATQPIEDESPSFETILVYCILVLLPMVIYLAYRYGKRIGKKETHPKKEIDEDVPVERDDNNNSETSFQAPEKNRALMVYTGPNRNLFEQSQFLQNFKKSDASQEASAQTDEWNESSGSRDKVTTVAKTLNNNNFLNNVSNIQADGCGSTNSETPENDPTHEITKFQVAVKHTYDSSNTNDLKQGLNEEKLKLHTSEEQIKKVEVTHAVAFEKKDGSLHKIETHHIKTTYSENAKEPENNAHLLKKTYQAYQSDPESQQQFGFMVKSSESPNSTDIALDCKAVIPFSKDHQISIPFKNGKVIIEQKITSENLVPGLENDEIPHETGKFVRIFKDPEPIGEGSFGEVYKVVHKLDGKIYAVKKVRLNLGKSGDLQQKKVFREVFAMTDLHHPNIVRYSTCWVEIEKIEEKKPRITNNAQQIEKTQLEPEEITEEQESEATSSVQEHTNTSSAGFAWAIGGDDGKEESKTINSRQKIESKINNKATVKKKDVDIQSQSLAKTINEESLNENSSISQLSRTTSEAIRGFRIYLYIQMEYCSGQSLRNYLDSSQNKHSSKQSLLMFKRILEGVDAIHERGILHRDLKPANIFLADNDNVKIGDFGLASLDNTEEYKESNNVRLQDTKLEKSLSKMIGTPMYASPEQEIGGRYNYKTDIYSLGLIFCEMVAGITTGHERYQLFTSVRSNQDLPAYFKEKYPKESEIILKMTAFSPEKRPTAKEVITDIDKLLKETV